MTTKDHLIELIKLAKTFYERFKKEEEKLPSYINIIDEIGANENSHTRFLVALFNYKDKDGKRSTIKSFFNFFNISTDKIDITNRVYFNKRCKINDINRYADVYFVQKSKDLKNGIGLIIENKIKGAKDQPNQVDDYVSAMINEGIPPENIHIFYLIEQYNKNTPIEKPELKTNKEYNKKGEYEQNYRLITYKEHILPWLKDKLLPSIPYKETNIINNIEIYISHFKHCFGMIEDRNKIQLNILYNTPQIKKCSLQELYKLDADLDNIFQDELKKHFDTFQENQNQFILKQDKDKTRNKYIKLELVKNENLINITLDSKTEEMLPDIGYIQDGGYYKILERYDFEEIEQALKRFYELRNRDDIQEWIGYPLNNKILDDSILETVRNIITLQSAVKALIADKKRIIMTTFSQICLSKDLNHQKEYSPFDFDRSYYCCIDKKKKLSIWCELQINTEPVFTVGIAFDDGDNKKAKKYRTHTPYTPNINNLKVKSEVGCGYVWAWTFKDLDIDKLSNKIESELPNTLDSLKSIIPV